ncbi:ice-binding family protein [Streptomyces sp. MS1.AVA.4]|uniref:Ice-binding family protein n=1 Tax=Streptomyces pratisoli TaxID=3139917 RepID=A0ACC6QJH2_9ACTN
MAVNATPSAPPGRRKARFRTTLFLLPAAALVMAITMVSNLARAAEAPVGLGTATSYAVLAGSGVTNTGPTVINGDLGVSPGSSVTGFPPGIVNGVQHVADVPAAQAQSDLTIAYNDAAGRAPTASLTSPGDLGGLTLTPGVYNASSSQNPRQRSAGVQRVLAGGKLRHPGRQFLLQGQHPRPDVHHGEHQHGRRGPDAGA